jgi:hypothetical protein
MGFISFGLNETMTTILPPNTVPEFHYFKRYRYDWHLVLYCHDDGTFFGSQSEAAYTKREGQARDFINRIQRRLGLRQKEMIFFATTEFGDTGNGHLHLLISMDGLRKKGRLDKVEYCTNQIPHILDIVRSEMFPTSIKIGYESILADEDNQKRLLSYVCKKEDQRDYKHCFYSRCIK